MLLTKSLDTPDESRNFEHGEISLVCLGGVTFARAAFRPGWRWSEDLKPIAGTDSCQVPHQAVVISGRLRVKTDDGEEIELVAGDAHVVGPGHDAWVVGDEPCVILDFAAPQEPVHVASCPCGVSFRIENDGALDHLVAAVQEHASGSHDHQVSREHILAELEPPVIASA
jgi:hypothetical protein